MRLVICALYYAGNVMVLAEKDFALDLQGGYRFAKALLLSFLIPWLIFSSETIFAGDWTPCEGPCSDLYTSVDATIPASGSSYATGQTIEFSTKVERYTMGTWLPFETEVSTSGGTGWSADIVSPATSCIDGPSTAYCNPDLQIVYILIDVTIGTGSTRVTVRLHNTLLPDGTYISPVFYFDVVAADVVRVTGLTDMPSTWNGSGDEENNDNVCIYSSVGTYDLLVEGTVDAGSYVLAEGGGTKIPIDVYWNNTSGTSGRTLLDSADDPSLTGVTGGDTSSQTCSGGNTANISWKALEADLQTKPAGTYSATMTITTLAP